MTRPRCQQVSLAATPYYHCICRCVRRAFLCGEDSYSGRSFEHRRQWVVERLARLVDVFAIDLCAYAVMSNHYHLVLRINERCLAAWSDREVASRWLMLFTGPPLVRRWLAGEVDRAEESAALEIVARWRTRLGDLGWFMKCLNEHLARRANEEDGCKGRFWESRFKSQALLDEKALLACMAYVDLNPVRAAMADVPEESEYTSIRQRSESLKSSPRDGAQPTLLPLVDQDNTEAEWQDTLCDVRVMEYLALVDWTGRAVRHGKRGAISAQAPPVLSRLGIDEAAWLSHMRPRRNRVLVAIGAAARITDFLRHTGRQRLMDRRDATALYQPA